MTVVRHSPFAAAHAEAAATLHEVGGMLVPETYPGPRSIGVSIIDMSHLPKCGVKGASAEAFLLSRGVALPARHNRLVAHRDGVVARLGFTEFFMEAQIADDWTLELRRQESWPAQVVPVLRQDASLLLCGARVQELLLQVCSFDFEALETRQDECVMTQMLGVSILAMRTSVQAHAYRVWFDPTFATFMWHTLLEIATELGGGAMGLRDAVRLGMVRA